MHVCIFTQFVLKKHIHTLVKSGVGGGVLPEKSGRA